MIYMLGESPEVSVGFMPHGRIGADFRPFEVAVVAAVFQKGEVGMYYLVQMPVQDLFSDGDGAAEPAVVVDRQPEPFPALFCEIVLQCGVVDTIAATLVQNDSLNDGVSECYAFLHVSISFLKQS